MSDPLNADITEIEPAVARPGPLSGRRLLVKDLIDTAGMCLSARRICTSLPGK